MRQTKGVIHLKLTNSQNKVMAFSHRQPPPYFPVFLEAAVKNMDQRTFFSYCCFSFFVFFIMSPIFIMPFYDHPLPQLK